MKKKQLRQIEKTLAAGNRDGGWQIFSSPNSGTPVSFQSKNQVLATSVEMMGIKQTAYQKAVMNITFFTLTQQHTRENFVNLVTYSDG